MSKANLADKLLIATISRLTNAILNMEISTDIVKL